jgi:hypothetical protein
MRKSKINNQSLKFCTFTLRITLVSKQNFGRSKTILPIRFNNANSRVSIITSIFNQKKKIEKLLISQLRQKISVEIHVELLIRTTIKDPIHWWTTFWCHSRNTGTLGGDLVLGKKTESAIGTTCEKRTTRFNGDCTLKERLNCC